MPHIKAHDDLRRDFLYYATADGQAMPSIEVDTNGVDTGAQITAKWRGRPVFIRRHDKANIELSRSIPMDVLRDKENRNANKPGLTATDENCSGNKAGDFGGWHCARHGLYYNSAGRIGKAPAPENLHIPVNTVFDAITIHLG